MVLKVINKPVEIIGDSKRFQLLSMFIDDIYIQKVLFRMIRKWRGKTDAENNLQFQKDITKVLNALTKYSIVGFRKTFSEIMKDAIFSGTLFKEYNLQPLEAFLIFQRKKFPKKILSELPRDREWYWRHKLNESFTHIAQKYSKEIDITDTVKKAIRQYKLLITREK